MAWPKASTPRPWRCVGWQGELQWQAAVGRVSRDPAAPPTTLETSFDLASLTKPLATALALMVLTEAGKLAPDASLGEFLPVAWLPPDKRPLTLAQLLAHRAGLPAWEPFYREVLQAPPEARVSLLPRLAAAAPLAQPPDTATLYSDLGFMLLQAVVEAVSGLGLDRFCREQIYRPLGLNILGFRPISRRDAPRCAPQEADTQVRPYYMPPRKPASLLDGIFLARCTTKTPGPPGAWPGTPGSSAPGREVFALVAALYRAYHGEAGLPCSPATVRRFLTPVAPGARALGFDVPSADGRPMLGGALLLAPERRPPGLHRHLFLAGPGAGADGSLTHQPGAPGPGRQGQNPGLPAAVSRGGLPGLGV